MQWIVVKEDNTKTTGNKDKRMSFKFDHKYVMFHEVYFIYIYIYIIDDLKIKRVKVKEDNVESDMDVGHDAQAN